MGGKSGKLHPSLSGTSLELGWASTKRRSIFFWRRRERGFDGEKEEEEEEEEERGSGLLMDHGEGVRDKKWFFTHTHTHTHTPRHRHTCGAEGRKRIWGNLPVCAKKFHL